MTYLTTYIPQIMTITIPFLLFLHHILFENPDSYTLYDIYQIMDQEEDTQKIEEVKKPPTKEKDKYEDKYKDRYHNTLLKDYDEETMKSYKTKILMYTTPLGNVVMYWDQTKEVFVYYSDTSIPYRYLETVSRKYVTLFDCKQVYIDMEEELQKAAHIQKQCQEQRQEQPNQPKKDPEQPKKDPEQPSKSKDVFAKLKTYNNQAIKDLPKNPAQKSQTPRQSNPSSSAGKLDNKTYIVKERSNRYSYEGKMMNFGFLKKVDRKVVDKSYALTFKEFKELQQANKKLSQ